MNYKGIHYRLRQDRGPARLYLCIDCGKQAEHWSYREGCLGELVDPRNGFPYTESVWDYDPRCNGCHQRHDRKVRPRPPDHQRLITVLATVANLGNQHTKGRVMPEHEKQQRSDAQKGRPKTAEHKEKMRRAALRRWARQRGEMV